ncbi:membrane associated rhomboid family serine protease [Thermosporothrix hazakensis]|uniref:Membrane associated rhomboid family serine protease n=3 Tax=Thermosporothrix TaxID=768650 RepID=A0A326UDT4_THEHA|nr:rhomboid family intramembrane serine protease [Thermosporothrix hazakensis]PZW36587.1 membrane associated rhomboid family serine protease [Thermosporothrix hazakensis]BBH89055.1 hypothetical protein KTC_38060 [Thermosporothrix sp. COM3]GCE47238.1 hypothetical protein KTH_21070 [Thermosporothrix hazakensis]
MEAQTNIQLYMEQGRQALAQGQGREAALAYAHAAQAEPENPMVHLGLAEANLALRSYDIVRMACRRVQELQPQGGLEATLAQALLDLLDRRYERALSNVDKVLSEDPGIAYAHALRSYLLRIQGQDYDANLARARAARLSFGGRFEDCFPPMTKPSPAPIERSTTYTGGYQGTTEPSRKPQQESIPAWTRPNQMQRQMLRTNFLLRYIPVVTYTIIGINVLIYLLISILMIVAPDLASLIYGYGVLAPTSLQDGEIWRLITSMFLHAPPPSGILHIGLNMLSLLFMGRDVEILFGKWRFLLIYFLAGLGGGLLFILMPGDANVVVLGASGAIFGVFGALGAFLLTNRRAMGELGRAAFSNWIFWLGLNLLFGFMPGSNIAVMAHIGGLIVGFVLALILLPGVQRSRRI